MRLSADFFFSETLENSRQQADRYKVLKKEEKKKPSQPDILYLAKPFFKSEGEGSWVARLVKHPNFGPDHDLVVCGSCPC